MTTVEILRKYLPMRTSGQITGEQMDRVLKLAKDYKPLDNQEPKFEPEPVDEDGEEETVELDLELSSKSQKDRILALLADGEWHTTLEIMEKAYRVFGKVGNCRYASRIDELRKEGYDIACEHDHDKIFKYRIIKYANKTLLPQTSFGYQQNLCPASC